MLKTRTYGGKLKAHYDTRRVSELNFVEQLSHRVGATWSNIVMPAVCFVTV